MAPRRHALLGNVAVYDGSMTEWVVYLLVAGNIQASPPSRLRGMNEPVRSLRKGFSRPLDDRAPDLQIAPTERAVDSMQDQSHPSCRALHRERFYLPKPLYQPVATWEVWLAEYRTIIIDVQAIYAEAHGAGTIVCTTPRRGGESLTAFAPLRL